MDRRFILSEIGRTATANGGVPLGSRRFSSETGISERDWSQYWARWSDALQEAGYAPNELTAAYGKTDLLDTLAKLALELGKLPAKSDLRFKARHDSGFPSSTTFERLGRKSEIVDQLLDYCRNHKEYAAVVTLCEQYEPRARSASGKLPVGEVEFGVVYLINSGRFYKIGRTNAARRREYELSIQLPERAKLVHVIRTDDPSGIEAYWHKRFDPKRKNGEWFKLDVADVAAFKRRKSFM